MWCRENGQFEGIFRFGVRVDLLGATAFDKNGVFSFFPHFYARFAQKNCTPKCGKILFWVIHQSSSWARKGIPKNLSSQVFGEVRLNFLVEAFG